MNLSLALVLVLGACAPKTQAASPQPLPVAAQQLPPPLLSPADYGAVSPEVPWALPPLPLWVDRYAERPLDMGYRLDIPRTMAGLSLSRLDAVELQNGLRDRLREDVTAPPGVSFADALADVRAGKRESRVDPERLAKAPLIVVFDLDETLLDQSYPYGASCRSFSYDDAAKIRYVQLAPGWEAAFERVRKLGAEIILFSANLDQRTESILSTWTWRGQPLLNHPDIAGWMSNSHLVWDPKGADNRGVPEASKDLRVFNEDLSRVVLIDDNPLRVFQLRNMRWTYKFQADDWCRSEVDPQQKALLEGELDAAVDDIEEAWAWSVAHQKPFAEAFLPWSALAGSTMTSLISQRGLTRAQAAAWIREHPWVVARDL